MKVRTGIKAGYVPTTVPQNDDCQGDNNNQGQNWPR